MYEFYLQGMVNMMGEKPERKSEIEQKKKPFGYPPIAPSLKKEANCFSVSEATENKPELPNRQKKRRLGRCVGDLRRLQDEIMVMKILDLRKKSGTGSRVREPQRMEVGKILETNN